MRCASRRIRPHRPRGPRRGPARPGGDGRAGRAVAGLSRWFAVRCSSYGPRVDGGSEQPRFAVVVEPEQGTCWRSATWSPGAATWAATTKRARFGPGDRDRRAADPGACRADDRRHAGSAGRFGRPPQRARAERSRQRAGTRLRDLSHAFGRQAHIWGSVGPRSPGYTTPPGLISSPARPGSVRRGAARRAAWDTPAAMARRVARSRRRRRPTGHVDRAVGSDPDDVNGGKRLKSASCVHTSALCARAVAAIHVSWTRGLRPAESSEAARRA